MKGPKISVLVPVYKVEPYLEQCLDSILGQTYQNLEIILVDDGSPDACGAICEDYAARDGRIRVIHQENRGLSAARNVALDAACGEWIGWVDSDDWIDPEMFETLLRGAIDNDADIAICGRVMEYAGRSEVETWEWLHTVDREMGLRLLLEDDRVRNYVWDKLYRRELYQGIRYPEGRIYEDLACSYRLFERARRVTLLPEACYHYRQRTGSIMCDRSLSGKLCYYIAATERRDAMAEQWPQLRELLEEQCITSCVGLWACYYQNSREEREKAAPQLRQIAQMARHSQRRTSCTTLGLAGRLIVRLLPYDRRWAFALAGCVGWLYEKKHERPI